jgi:hypothetical protein
LNCGINSIPVELVVRSYPLIEKGKKLRDEKEYDHKHQIFEHLVLQLD